MKLFLCEQFAVSGYDTYDSFVVAAMTKKLAQQTHPNPKYPNIYNWPEDRSLVTVTYLGEAKEGTESGVICASFNAG